MDFNNTDNATLKHTRSSSHDVLLPEYIKSINNIANYSPYLLAVLLTVNIFEIVLAILGNLTVILTVVAFRQLWVPTNILVASLAVADFIIGLIMQTASAWSLSNPLFKDKLDCGLHCVSFIRTMGFIIITVSLAHLSLITLDRFAAIVYPLRYVTIITMSRTKKAVMFAWTTSFVFGSLASIPSPLENGANALWYLFMLLSCVFMITLHGKLYCISRKHAKKIREEIQSVTPGVEVKKERRGLMTAAIVTVALVISYLPVVALEIDKKLASGERGETAKFVHDIVTQFAIILILFNSTLNPLVYFFRSKKLRTYSWKLIKSIPRGIQECI